MISNGQARRIASEWQAPGNAYSVLQNTGEIVSGLASEIASDIEYVTERRESWPVDEYESVRRDLDALTRFVGEHGLGPVAEWGEWDDAPVTPEQLA